MLCVYMQFGIHNHYLIEACWRQLLLNTGVSTGWTPVHDDVIKWKRFPRYWPFVRGIHRSPVNSPHKCQWRGALMLTLICAWIHGWVNNRGAGDLRRHRAHYDVIVMVDAGSLHQLLFDFACINYRLTLLSPTAMQYIDMNHYPLLGVRLWNNDMHYMSCSVFMKGYTF